MLRLKSETVSVEQSLVEEIQPAYRPWAVAFGSRLCQAVLEFPTVPELDCTRWAGDSQDGKSRSW